MFHYWLIFFHILGAIFYVGGVIVNNLLARYTRKTGNLTGFLENVKILGPVIAIGAMITLIAGIGLVLNNPVLHFSMLWIIAGITMIVVGGITESAYFKRKLKAIEIILNENGNDSPDAVLILTRVINVSSVLNVMLLIVVWLMVFKPTV
jgi:hypothetical protein